MYQSQWDVFTTWMRARFAQTERGASLVEYALLLALIAVLCIAALRFLGDAANSKLSQTGSAIS
jgi:pilus assembly protein Flp/PilA